VYVVDRPGQGRPPYFPDVHGPYPAQAPTFEQGVKSIAGGGAAAHTQWPGSVQVGDSSVDQFMASQGPALANGAAAEISWRFCGAKLLDETGPAIFVTHGDGARFAMVAADERPALVKAIVALEVPAPFSPPGRGGPGFPAGPGPVPAAGPLRMTATPLAYDKLKGVGMAVVTAEASAAVQRDPQTIAFGKNIVAKFIKITSLSGFGTDKTTALADVAVIYTGPKLPDSDEELEYKRSKAASPDIDEGVTRKNESAPRALPADYKFDPQTGEPIGREQQAGVSRDEKPAYKFDPYTGQPISNS